MPEALSAAHVALGASVRSLRTDRDLSQLELAGRAGLHRSYLGGVERGTRNVSLTNIVALARALDVPPARLLADIG